MAIQEVDKETKQDLVEDLEVAGDVEVDDIQDIIDRLEFIVPQTDDPSTPALTFRSIFLGTLWAAGLSFANTVLAFRTGPFAVSANIAVILSYPLGVSLAAVLPSGILNPGPFSVKEHVLIYIMASCSGQPYGTENVVSQAMPTLMNNTNINFGSAFAFVFVTQFIGYGISGLMRRFLVKPTAMWWPGNLSAIAIFSSFHKVETIKIEGERYKLSRYVVFWIAFAAMFVYTWIPEFFMPVLQTVSTLCLFAGVGINSAGVPNVAGKMTTFNAVVSSSTNGVGFLGMAFDWSYIGSAYLTSPFWAVACNIGGSIVLQYIVTPILYYADVYGINALMTQDPYNHNPLLNTGHLFNGNNKSVTHALGGRVRPTFFYNVSDNYNLNLTAYNDVAPVHLTSFFFMCYAGSFLAITSSITHVIVWYGPDVYRQTLNAFRQIRDEIDAQDKHVKLMEAYPDVPDWAYLAFLGFFTILAIVVSVATPFGMPWWAIFFNLFLVAIFILPFGVIQAISGFGLGLNVLTEFVIGLMLPGQTVAVMAFKSWGTNNVIQALALVQDLKLGQYLHIPPYAMVFAQFWGTFLNALLATGAAWYMMFASGALLQDPNWQYAGFQVFYSAGGIWGAIGPQRFFGIGSLYGSSLWCFLVGFLLPLVPWLGNKYIVQSKYWHWINFPLIFTFSGPQSGYQNNFVGPLLVSYLSSVVLFNKNREFFQKYIYVIGAAFDGSAALAVLIISIVGVFNYFFADYNVFNPNTNNWPGQLDYYCYPDRDYNDFGCEWYLDQGMNTTGDGILCVEATA
ncbi:hypothetical protein HK100_010229 [Physocladia obscura]|uniref:OPT superfamily oligopeptide transporter n=1 Tax=Physocladia obscura TaxID=109957 RepID=A0AAD5XHN2_9FUNG|nr:hypothetical protein HK100_010229 [Physocladia obscura]